MARTSTFDAKELAERCKNSTPEDTAKEFGCSLSTVINACRVHGVQVITKASADRKKIAAWVGENDATIADAVRHFGCSRNRIGQACKDHGVSPRKEESTFNPPSPRSNFEILAMLMQNYIPSDIAREMAVSRQRVDQIKANAEAVGLLGENAIVVLKASVKVSDEKQYTVAQKLAGQDLHGLPCRIPDPVGEQKDCEHEFEDIPNTNNMKCTFCGYTRRY